MVTLKRMVGNRRWDLREDVIAVQGLLREWGFYHGPCHGLYDRMTMAAVESFQRQFMPAPDGNVTPDGPTFWALRACHKAGKPMPSSSGVGPLRFLMRVVDAFGPKPGERISPQDIAPYMYSGRAAADAARWGGPNDALRLFAGPAFTPPKPHFAHMSHATRVANFGSFTFETIAGSDDIKILTKSADYKLESVDIPQLKGVPVGNGVSKGKIYVHKKSVHMWQELFRAWDDAGLMGRILMYSGPLAQRYIRGTAHDGQLSSLSNHSWGTAIDLNVPWNKLKVPPARLGMPGSVMELVSIANHLGWYWGGHFSRLDGMHFEIAQLKA
jgi:peptidoglycan hydrolase-like protein with peptidoglycan-binding domain